MSTTSREEQGMSTKPWIERLELSVNDTAPMDKKEAALVSIALSMKRIADALATCNAYGEVGSEAIGNSLVRALRDGARS